MEFPLLVRVIPSELFAPTFTFPKLKLLGLAVSCAVAVAPVPDRATVVGELFASLVIVRLPVRLPEEEGANWIPSVALWPAAMEDKGVPFVMVKAVPEMLAWETVTDAVPLLVKVTLWVALLPTETLPKLMFVALDERLFDPVDGMLAVV